MNTKNKLLFSVILPTYNRASFLNKAIESIINQTYQYWELIIIDDGSTDNTKEIVKKFNDSRILYIYQKNKGRSAARNLGIKKISGEWVCFIDSDSEFLKNRLLNFCNFIESNNQSPCIINTDIIYNFNNHIKNFVHYGFYVKGENQYYKLINNIIGTPQVCIHSSIIKKNLFNEKISIGEDMELWLRIVNKYSILYDDNNKTVMENIHKGRSVQKYGKSILYEYETWKYIIYNNKILNKIDKNIIKNRISSIFQDMSIYYFINNKMFYSIKFIIRSLLLTRNKKHIKFKLNLLINFLLVNRNKINNII